MASAVVGLSAAPAAAQVTKTSVTGGVSATWHSDPARCSRDDLCGVRGAFTAEQSPGPPFVFGGPGFGYSIGLLPDAAQVRVREARSGASLLCDDASVSPDSGGINVTVPEHRGRYSARLQGGVSSGRCAGPTAADFNSIPLPVHAEPWGVDMVGVVRFAAGPFDVELSSTLRIRTRRARRSTTVAFPTRPTGPPPRVEFVQYSYRLTVASGGLVVTFGGDPEPLCLQVGACGVYGRLNLTIPHAKGAMTVFFGRNVRRRYGRKAALRDLPRGRLGPPEYLPSLASRVRVASSVIEPGGERCIASVSLPHTAINAPEFGGGPTFELGAGAGIGVLPFDDPLRTWCPGPELSDVRPNDVLASAGLPQRSVGARRLVVTIAPDRAFGALAVGYRGRLRGSLRLTFELERITAGTEPESKAPF